MSYKNNPTARYRDEYCKECSFRQSCWGAEKPDNIQSTQELILCKLNNYFKEKSEDSIFNKAGYCLSCNWHWMSDTGCEKCKPHKEEKRKDFELRK